MMTLPSVSWLSDRPTLCAFPSFGMLRTVASMQISSPMTVAGQWRSCTAFPKWMGLKH